MIRIVSFLVLIALAAAGAAWIADQTGDVVLSWGAWRAAMSLPVFVLALGIAIVAAIVLWSLLRGIAHAPRRLRHHRREKQLARGRHAITLGLLAIGQGDSDVARRHAQAAKRHAGNDPLALLLHAQSAQLDGDRVAAHRAFQAMAERADTRLLGLRGLFIEAQRSDDPHAAVAVAEEALKLAPASTWASQAVLGFRCAQNDWAGALKILDANLAAGLIDRATFRRQRGVLLTARALELETTDRDLSRDSAMEAVKLAPTLVPAAVLAAKFQSEAQQIRRAIKLIEAAWLAQPHPDLADAYAHVKLGDSARQRLVRIETLAGKAPGHVESALAIARAAIDAAEFGRARDVLAPFTADSTQRVAMLMAEIERTEHGDSGRARAWTLRAVRARHDPVWTADGYVSDRWRPVSPVTGRIDAFQWQTPLAELPSDRMSTIETEILRETVLAPPPLHPKPIVQGPVVQGPVVQGPMLQTSLDSPTATSPLDTKADTKPDTKPDAMAGVSPDAGTAPGRDVAAVSLPVPVAGSEPVPAATAADQDSEPADEPMTATAPPAPPALPPTISAAPPPLFRDRADIAAKTAAAIPPVIPIVRAPDDPGVDDSDHRDEFAELNGGQPVGGWRGFVRRWGG